MTTQYLRVKPLGDTAAQMATLNPVLAQGEVAYESDTHLSKRGDGATPWNSLPYSDGTAFALSMTFGG